MLLASRRETNGLCLLHLRRLYSHISYAWSSSRHEESSRKERTGIKRYFLKITPFFSRVLPTCLYWLANHYDSYWKYLRAYYSLIFGRVCLAQGWIVEFGERCQTSAFNGSLRADDELVCVILSANKLPGIWETRRYPDIVRDSERK